MEGIKIHTVQPPPRAWLDVDLAAVRRNACVLRSLAGAPLLPMVKANGYGVGVADVVRVLEDTDPWGYGVATVPEGAELREMGIVRPIVVFTPVLAEEFPAMRAAGLTPALSSEESIRAWGSSPGYPYHLAIDTGMCRAGVVWRDAATLRTVVQEHPPAAAFTHFHSAERGTETASIQEERFREALGALEIGIPFLHAECSAAIVRGHRGAWDAVRPGLFLYGVGSGAGVAAEPEPVVSLRARVVELRWLEPGDTVSYDGTYTATRRERIATVALGYGDGYPRALSNRGTALINGARVPVRGLVTMDMTMFDVTDTPCEVGDIATLIGSDGGAILTVGDVAAAAGMSPYELLTGLPVRLDRRCHDEERSA